MFIELSEVVPVQKTILKDCSNHVGQFFLAKKSNFMDFGSYRRFLAILAHCADAQLGRIAAIDHVGSVNGSRPRPRPCRTFCAKALWAISWDTNE